MKQRLSKTIIFVTHDIVEAVTLGDRIAILHEGQLEQIGTPEEILENPATDFVRELFAKSVKSWKGFKNIL